MGSYPSAVVVKGKVYIGGGWAPSDEHKQTVIEYDPFYCSITTHILVWLFGMITLFLWVEYT